MKILIRNGRVYPMEGPVYPEGFVLLGDEKILAVGEMLDCPESADTILDMDGAYVLPGLVDAHTHIGLFNESLRVEGEDGNEDTDPILPQLRALDGVNPQDAAFPEALAAGVTTVLTGPGSANLIGGQFVAMKTGGICVDEMALVKTCAMKFALGENPKMTYHEKERAPSTRMSAAAMLREVLAQAQEYGEKRADEEEDCDLDYKLEALLPVLRREMPVQIHCHRLDDIFTAIRIAEEFQLDPVLVHATEGYRAAEYLARKQIPVITGPLLTTRSKPELAGQCIENTARLIAAGVPCAICTDYPEVAQGHLMLSAALAGLDELTAFAAVTMSPARIAKLDHRVGSIRAGKDADLVLYHGHPFDPRSTVQAVFLNGERVLG